MDWIEILKAVGIAIGVLDAIAGSLPDKWVPYHSFILKIANALDGFGKEVKK